MSDVAIDIMKNDPTSAAHVHQRVLEIVEDGLLSGMLCIAGTLAFARLLGCCAKLTSL